MIVCLSYIYDTKGGWKLEKLDGDILEIKVTSTDVSLRLRIREYANKNESSWLDDGTHLFRINLKDKKQENKGSWKADCHLSALCFSCNKKDTDSSELYRRI